MEVDVEPGIWYGPGNRPASWRRTRGCCPGRPRGPYPGSLEPGPARHADPAEGPGV